MTAQTNILLTRATFRWPAIALGQSTYLTSNAITNITKALVATLNHQMHIKFKPSSNFNIKGKSHTQETAYGLLK
jgi:hypothetical protein